MRRSPRCRQAARLLLPERRRTPPQRGGGPAARIRTALEARGAPIGPLDTLIAGTALANGATLVTRNAREFERVEGLALENWWDG